MSRLATLVILFLYAQPGWAQSIFAPDKLAPGSYRVEYGGLYKIAENYIIKLFEDAWRDQQVLLYNSGQISPSEFNKSQEDVYSYYGNHHGPPWWTRQWWQSMMPGKKGSPPNGSILVQRGSTFLLINTPLFSLSNSFDFRWKGLEAAFDFTSNDVFSIGIEGAVKKPKFGLKLDVSPTIAISSPKEFSDVKKILNRIGLTIEGVIIENEIPMVSIDARTWYRPRDNDLSFVIEMSLIQW